MHRPSPALRLASFLALAAALLTAAQSAFILLRGDAFCLNEGCRVVEDLTRVPPLAVNLAGLVFFLTLFVGLRASGSLWRRLPRFVAPLLLAGLAVEGVFIGFQLFVAGAFCSYCLAVLGAVVALNLLLGLRQAAHGLLLFLAALLAFASLEVQRPGQGGAALKDGVFASRPGTVAGSEHHLFYSSTCAHCERVIGSLRTSPGATVLFHPIDRVQTLDLPGAQLRGDYAAEANRALLTGLGLDEIPVLITKSADGYSILRGETAITARLGQPAAPAAANGQSPLPTAPLIPGLPPATQGEGCQVATDCDDPPAATARPAAP